MELRHREAGIVWAANLRGRHTARVDEFGGSLVAEARYSVSALLPKSAQESHAWILDSPANGTGRRNPSTSLELTSSSRRLDPHNLSDGGFILQEEGSECGGVNYQGQLEQQGDTLTGRCDNGQTFTTKFALDGSNGLWVAGRLYGRQ